VTAPGREPGPVTRPGREPGPVTRPGREPGPLLGRSLVLDVGAVAHGGHCVARHEGRVVFVRHALPGERVRAAVTEDAGGSYCRADAVEVLVASPDRVQPPCAYAGPGRCGGCDWQHAAPERQRHLKAEVVREQLVRLGGLTAAAAELLLPGPVEELPGGALGWRTRVRFAVSEDGRLGLRRHRSSEVVEVTACPLGTEDVDAVGATRHRWPGAAAVEVVASSVGDDAVVVTPAGPQRPEVPPVPESVAVIEAGPRGRVRARRGHARVREDAAGRRWLVQAAGFWQVHPAAPDALTGAVLEALEPRRGEHVLDLYGGAGLFGGVLAERVGPEGSVTVVEQDPAAAADARRNLRELPAVRVEHGRVDAVLRRTGQGALRRTVGLVVLDPPRSGAGAGVVRAVAARAPRAVAYVACDPAALARDVATFDAAGYRLRSLRALDLFPMTHHVECVALLVPAGVPAAAG